MGGVIAAVEGALDLTGKKASSEAIGYQQAATQEAKQYFQPYSEAGIKALAGLENIDVTKDPAYQFRMSEAMKALTARQAAGGRAISGGAMKELTRYSQDYAANEYQNAYSRMSGLAGMGLQAGAGMAGLITDMGQAQAAARMGQQQSQNTLIGDLGGAAIGAFFSDATVKENIESIDKSELAEMKKYLKAYAFNYIDEQYGSGDWVGVMAQDLEKSKLGKTLVHEVNGKKAIDQKKVLSLFLATMAEGA